jgi:hypothetical protein
MKPRSGLVLAAVGLLLFVALQASCAEAEVLCSPEGAGFEGQPRVTFTELPGTVEKTTCVPALALVRSEAELRAAYRAAGVRLEDEPASGGSGDPVALPAIDFANEVVLVREAFDDQDVVWVVTRDGALTAGTQGCTGFGTGGCRVQFFSLATTRATSAAGHGCRNIGCGGAPQNTE